MSDANNTSPTYKFIRKLGFNYSEEEYGQISLIAAIGKFFANPYHALLQSMMDWVIFAPIAPRMLRPWLLRRMGATVGKGVFIGDHCRFDLNHANMIKIEDNVHITGGTRILCHKRNLNNYRRLDDSAKLPYHVLPVLLKKGCMIGMESMIMPGVTIGEGSIIGAAALISKDIPDWVMAVGAPAKVIKEIPER